MAKKKLSKRAAQLAQRKKKYLKALEHCLGNKSEACKESGIGRRTVYDWIEDDPEFEEATLEINEHSIDYVESQLMKVITGYELPERKAHWNSDSKSWDFLDGVKHIGPDTTGIIFFLKTRAKDRGYIEKQEIDVNAPMNITVKHVDEMPAQMKKVS